MDQHDTTDQAKAALQQFGFLLVPLDEAGAPTPGLIADRLGDITTALEEAVAHGDLGAINNAVTELGRLCMALEAWDDWKKGQEAGRVLTAQEFLEELAPVPDFQEQDDEDQGRKSLSRRRACYSEVWWFDQVLVPDANGGESIIDLGEGKCTDIQLIDEEDVQEIAPDDLDDAEARTVAEYLAIGTEYEAVKQMNLQEVRQWLKRKLLGDRQKEEQQ